MYSDMKRFLCIFIIGIIYIGCWAQSPENASRSYMRFKNLSATGLADKELYDAVYGCYLDNMAAIQALNAENPEYKAAKDAIVSIWPFMPKAATFYDRNDRGKALLFSRAYVDVAISDVFHNEHLVKDSYYPTIVFYAASNTFNARDYKAAIRYFKEYLKTGEKQHQYNVRKYMAIACIQIKDYEQAKDVIADAVMANPSDYDLLHLAINACVESNDNKSLQKYLSKALAIKPNDQNLRNLQGKIYEESGNYADALKVYKSLFSENPSSLTYAKHVALNNFNLGVLFTNKATLENDKRIASQYDNQALVYFETAIPTIKEILKADPGSTQYSEALAIAYQMTGRENQSSSESRAHVPSIITYSTPEHPNMNSPDASDTPSENIPLYSQYAKKHVEESIGKWQAKDPYETIEEYKARVSEKTRNLKIAELLKEAESRYLHLYARDVRISDFRLCPYDAEHEVFLAESEWGDIIIPVPRANNEARIFESSWNGTQCMNPRYAINNDKIVLRGLTFVTPMGKSYRFDDTDTKDYVQTEVDIQFADINYDNLSDTRYEKPKMPNKKVKVTVGGSDIDKNIPETKVNNDRTFAVIIANEDYDIVADVPMATNDGRTFSRYCAKTLGLPENNIRLYENATYGIMRHALNDIRNISSAYNGDINVIFYYAGHGFPDENSKEAYLLPVDGDGVHTDVSYSLNKLYSELNGMSAKSVIVFLDACFSGANRDGSMLVAARGIALKSKDAVPQGNMVVFSAASADETAFPYEEKGHGMFTYYLLKKIQESKGSATLGEISSYVINNVRQQSIVINRKSQTPHISSSGSFSESWEKIRLKP